MDKTTELCEVD